MKIRKTNLDDLNTVLSLYENARAFMAANGNPTQWGTQYPPVDTVKQDISEGFSYVCEENGRIIAVFYYQQGEDSTYLNIHNGQWLNNAPYGVVHRITSDGSVPGTAGFCLNWAFEQCGNLKIDTHENNYIMQHLLGKLGFTKCGYIYTDDGTERIAYQKEESEAN